MSQIKYTTEVFPPQFSDTVIAELDPRFSRQTVEITAEADMPFGLVMSKGDDGWAPFTEAGVAAAAEGDEAASSGAASSASGEPCAILITPLEKSEAAQKAVVIRGYAIINANGLAWDESVTDKEAALEALAAKGFVIKRVEGE